MRAGELIIGLQIVGANIQRLGFVMAAEIDRRQRRGAMVSPQKATDEARGVSRSKASFTARRKAAVPYRSSSRSSCAV